MVPSSRSTELGTQAVAVSRVQAVLPVLVHEVVAFAVNGLPAMGKTSGVGQALLASLAFSAASNVS